MNKVLSKKEINFATVYLIQRSIKTKATDIITDSNLVLFESKKSGNIIKEIFIKLPYCSDKLEIIYSKSKYFKIAKKYGLLNSLDTQRQTSFLLQEKDKIIIQTANGSDYHKKHECLRRKLNVPTGTRYELCEGCSPKNHSESKATLILYKNGFKFNPKIHTAYLWGHWWPCEFCVENMLKIGIPRLYLSKTWTRNFLKIEKL